MLGTAPKWGFRGDRQSARRVRRYDALPHRIGGHLMRSISVFAALLVLGSGFAVAQEAAHDQHAAAPAAAAALTREKAPHGAKVFIVSPKNGATVGREVHVKFGVKGIEIKPAGDATPNTGHHHLLIDAKELPPLDAPIP